MKSVKLLVAGSRGFGNYKFLTEVLDIYQQGFDFRGTHYEPRIITEIIHGGARGADSLADKYAQEKSIPCTVFPAEWDIHGKKAGYVRNHEMWKVADEGVVFWDNKSRGTAHSLELSVRLNKLLIVGDYTNLQYYIHNRGE